jgi:hypothetical protein
MDQQSINIREIRDVANRFDTNSIESCIQLAMENKENPCYSAFELEDAMNVLAKANFVKSQMEQGMSLAEAIRDLGKRIRSVQGS